MHKSKIILSFLLMLLMLTACEKKISFEEILTSSECSAPCWMDIEPGKTTKEEALSHLTNLPELVDTASIFIRIYGGNEQIGWSFLNSKLSGVIELNDGLVSSISLGYYTCGRGIRLERVVEIYGPPENIYYERGSGDVSVFRIFLLNSKKGIEYEIIQPEADRLIISPDNHVCWISFLGPTILYERLSSNLDGETDNLENHHFKWAGYTEIPLPQ